MIGVTKRIQVQLTEAPEEKCGQEVTPQGTPFASDDDAVNCSPASQQEDGSQNQSQGESRWTDKPPCLGDSKYSARKTSGNN